MSTAAYQYLIWVNLEWDTQDTAGIFRFSPCCNVDIDIIIDIKLKVSD